MTMEQLTEEARKRVAPRDVSPSVSAGYVAAALLSESGKVYTGVNIDSVCSVGFCAEHAAIAAMIAAGESRVLKVAAVSFGEGVIPPCGRCREFLYQINRDNLSAEVALSGGRTATLGELLPERWN